MIAFQLIITMVALDVPKNTVAVAERISRSAEFTVNAPVEKVFPLFGPVREREWADGWNPRMVYSTTNLVDEHMVFTTEPRFEGEPDYTWVVTQYAPEKRHIEYMVSTDERIWFVRVVCRAEGGKTKATVTYTYTGLTSRGCERNQQALDRMFADNLQDWGQAINHYLSTGTILKSN